MVETVIAFLEKYVSYELTVFIVSMLPVLELRGGLIAASLLDIPWHIAAPICLVGTILPVPFILLFIKKIFALLRKSKLFERLVHRFEAKAVTKGAEMIEKYPARIQLALFLFVAIPLPGTGAWTGSLIASFLDLPIKRSLPAIVLGCCTAALIMLAIAYAAPSLIGIK